MIIIGAKGFAKEVMEVLHKADNTENLVFYDDVNNNISGKLFGQFPILKTLEAAKEYFEDTTIEQATNFIWRTICHTAEIKSITEFVVSDAPPKKHYGFKKKLSDEELQKLLKR